MNRRRESRRRGFTLIELLVVVGVIAVLIAILLPSLAKAKEVAKRAVCQTRIRGWGQAFIFYTSDFNGDLPLDGDDGTTNHPIGVWNDQFLWFNGLTKYMGTGNQSYDQLQKDWAAGGTPLPKGTANSAFMCPDAEDAGAGSGDIMCSISNTPGYKNPGGFFQVFGWPLITNNGKFNAPSTPRPMLLCYGMNSQLRQWVYPDGSDPPYPGRPVTPQDVAVGAQYIPDLSKYSQIKPASMVPIMAEKRINPNELPPINGQPAPNDNKALSQSKLTANRFAGRHNGGGNIAFADDHVEWFLNSTLQKGTGSNSNDAYNIPNVVIWSPFAPLGGSHP